MIHICDNCNKEYQNAPLAVIRKRLPAILVCAVCKVDIEQSKNDKIYK